MSEQPPVATDLQIDFPFDYTAHVSEGRGIGRLPDDAVGTEIAVIGAGGSGLTAAYELMRAGCRPILYEAERDGEGPGGHRLGGRMFSRRLAETDSAVVELGCMRFPDTARLLRHYTDTFGLRWLPFRENYAAGVTPRTVLEVDGNRYETERITDLYPLNEEFRQAHLRWEAALERIGLPRLLRGLAARDRATVAELWRTLLRRYTDWSFYRFLRAPEGAGLTQDQARLLGTAGIGPAAWDCFFDVSFLEIVRMLLTSQGADLYYLQEGISALAERFWTHRATGPDGGSTSLEEINGGAPRPGVTALDVEDDPSRGVVVHSEDGRAQRFAAAVFTPQLHLLETNVDLRSTRAGGSPFGPRLWRAVRGLSYWESSKTALVTREPFWEGTGLDGVTLTDRLPRATYTMDYGEPRGDGGRRGVLVLSFTWAQDAMKVAASDLDERVGLFTRELGRVHPDVADELARQAADADAATISWEARRNFRGLCRLARPGEYPYQWDLFAHFMKDFPGHPVVPGEPPNALFLAGDDTAWSPGWLDHALASGINAAWGVLRMLGGRSDPGNPGPGDHWGDPDLTPVAHEGTRG
ncbi:flavin monoamine oxidase family protein [Streptomyces sp. DT24]|uniref:flavin monoamine oxidase family protein n=1 Tax=unclassified Streptomyces TaxID=2593676 RepID=UPI003CEA15A2